MTWNTVDIGKGPKDQLSQNFSFQKRRNNFKKNQLLNITHY